MNSLAHQKQNTTESESTRTFVPRVDIFERDDAVQVFADMPGVEPANVDVRFENGELTIHGKRPAGRGGAVNYFRNFTLGDHLATDRISAEIKHGVLSLTLPKVEAVKPRKITVNG